MCPGDVPALLDDAISLGFLPPDVDRTHLLPALRRVFSNGKVAAADANGDETQHIQYKSAQRRQQFSSISNELNAIFFEYPFVVPEYFALITRALIVLEGIAVIGDPGFDIFAASYPYASRRAVQLLGPRQVLALFSTAAKGGARQPHDP